MIQPLRRVHYWTWIAMIAILAAAFISSTASRRDTTPRNAGVHWEKPR